jgi:hypothetical protein
MTAFLIKILEKYNLQQNLEWQINGHKESIIEELKSITSENYYSGILAALDLTVPKGKKFIGTITDNGFVIRKRMRQFDLIPIMAKVKAEFKTVDGRTILVAKVNGMGTISFAIRLLILAIVVLLAILVIFEALIPPIGEVNPFPNIINLIFIATVLVLFPMSLGRRDVQNLKIELNNMFE